MPRVRPESGCSGRVCSGRRSSPTGPRSRRSASSSRSGSVGSSGARDTPSPTPALILPTCGRRRFSTETSGSSPARRCGPRSHNGPTGASSSPAPTVSEKRHKGLSYLLVPMRQPGVELRPITQLTGTSEFNEVFFDEARTPSDMVVGEVGEGWRVALATLAFERGVALLGHQVRFSRELDSVIEIARASGSNRRPGHASAHRTRLDHSFHSPDEHVALVAGTRGTAFHSGGLHLEAVLEHVAPGSRRARHGRDGARCDCRTHTA